MPIDVSPGSFAAIVIRALFWWTVLSPAGLLAVAALCGRRPRLRTVLSLVVLVPPIVTLLPVAVMHGGTGAVAAAAGALVLAAAVALALLGERFATAAFVTGVVGGMVGSVALVGALVFS